jgi:hypothetical protein
VELAALPAVDRHGVHGLHVGQPHREYQDRRAAATERGPYGFSDATTPVSPL